MNAEEQKTHRRRLQRRSATVLTLATFAILALMGRLFFIQVAAPHNMQGHDLVASAVEQRREKFVLDSGRGDILDRNGVSLTGSVLNGIVVFPVWQQDLDLKKLNDLAVLLHTDTNTLAKMLNAKQEPYLLRLPNAQGKLHAVKLSDEEVRKVTALQMTGIYAKQVKVRYDDQSLARQVVGFLGEDPNLVASEWGGTYPLDEKVGKLGLEYEFQNELHGLGLAHTISYFTDASKKPLNGLGIRESTDENHALSVKTTLDANIQHSVEAAMDHYHIDKGAVVLLDAKSEDVLAMGSRPNYDQNQPLSQNKYPANLALKATFPGSVFKTVIAAAALETGVVKPTDEFDCPGHIDIGDGTLNCWTTHGHITVEQAFAESCNVTFATLAMKLGRDKIDEYAKRFGLGSPIGRSYDGEPQFEDEEKGSIFLKQGAAERLLANTGIGQEDVRITPLQAAHLMAVIADGGEAGAPRLVESLDTPDSLLYKEFNSAPKQRVLQVGTAETLQQWCRDVVHTDKGTAHVLDTAAMTVAGKTGTAQTGDPNADHQWFAGFAPAVNPKYVIVVMDESVPHGQQRVTERIALQIINALPK